METEMLRGELQIPFINADCRFWMIRTKGGYFYEEFIRNEFIAIGWNYLLSDTLKLKMVKKDLEALKERIKKIYKTNYPGNALKKCDKFVKEMKSGDIAMIVDNGRISFAFIGEYYEERDQAFSVDDEINTLRLIDTGAADKGIRCPFKKRRKIHIIRTLNTDEPINPYLFKAMAMNRHSLSCLDDYSNIILSSCFDMYQFGDKTAVTFRVKTKNRIKPIDLAELLTSVTMLIRSLDQNVQEEDISAQTTLNSPGEVVISVINSIPWQSLLVFYLAVFGGSIYGVQFPSLLSIVKELINSKGTRELRNNEIEQSRLRTETMRLENKKMQIEIDRMTLENSTIIESVNALVNTSRKLDISPFDKKVLPMSEVSVKGKKNT